MDDNLERIRALGADHKGSEDETYLRERLRELGVLQAELEGMKVVRQMMINDATPDEVRQTVEDIEAEFALQEAAVEKKIAQLKEDMKPRGLKHGQKIVGRGFTLSFVKGERVDPKKLRELQEMYPAIHDQIEACFVYKPSVRFVKNSQGD